MTSKLTRKEQAWVRSWVPASIEDTKAIADIHLKLYGVEYDSDSASPTSRKIATYETAKQFLFLQGLPDPQDSLEGIQATKEELKNLQRLESLYFKTVQNAARLVLEVPSVPYNHSTSINALSQAIVNYNNIHQLRMQLETKFEEEQAYARSPR